MASQIRMWRSTSVPRSWSPTCGMRDRPAVIHRSYGPVDRAAARIDGVARPGRCAGCPRVSSAGRPPAAGRDEPAAGPGRATAEGGGAPVIGPVFIVAVALLGYALLSRRLASTPVTEAMVFAVVGI